MRKLALLCVLVACESRDHIQKAAPAAGPPAGTAPDVPSIEAARDFYEKSYVASTFGPREFLDFHKTDGRTSRPQGVETYDLLFASRVFSATRRPAGVWNCGHGPGDTVTESGVVTFQKYESGWKPVNVELQDDCEHRR